MVESLDYMFYTDVYPTERFQGFVNTVTIQGGTQNWNGSTSFLEIKKYTMRNKEERRVNTRSFLNIWQIKKMGKESTLTDRKVS